MKYKPKCMSAVQTFLNNIVSFIINIQEVNRNTPWKDIANDGCNITDTVQ